MSYMKVLMGPELASMLHLGRPSDGEALRPQQLGEEGRYTSSTVASHPIRCPRHSSLLLHWKLKESPSLGLNSINELHGNTVVLNLEHTPRLTCTNEIPARSMRGTLEL